MFDGQIAVVTGAGSPAGIGYAVAEELAKHGAFVVISDLPAVEARLEGALANLRSRYSNVAMCAMDVSATGHIGCCRYLRSCCPLTRR